MSRASTVKITRPSLSGILLRKRLFQQIDRARRRPVIWVSGPPGSGKTTLVSSYLDDRRLPCLWYQVDGGDADAATFFYYLGLAGKKAAPRRRKLLPLFTPEYWQGMATFSKRYFEDLFGRLPVPSAVVFDNCQEAPEGSSFYDVMRNAMTEIPEEINVFFLSRRAAPAAFARLKAGMRMERIGWKDLKLTEKESGAIVKLLTRETPSVEAVKHFSEKTQGWAAGLVLMAENVRFGGAGPQSFADSAPEEVFDYFASEIFGKSDPETKDFLLASAFLPSMTGRMAQRQTGLASAWRILERLSAEHFFTEKRSENAPVYQYHPLFREFLLEKARDTWKRAKCSALAREAAVVLEEAGNVEDSARLFLDAEDWEGLSRLIASQAETLIMQGRSRLLEQWLAALPEKVMAQSPWLQYWMGASLLHLSPPESELYFQRAHGLFTTLGHAEGEYLSWSGVVDAISYSLSNLRRLDPWVSRLDGLIRRHRGFPSPAIETRVAASMFCALVVRHPNHRQLTFWQEKAVTLVEKSPDVNLKTVTLFYNAWHVLNTGDLAKAALLIEKLKQTAASRNVSPFTLIAVKVAEAILHLFRGNHARCLEAVNEGLDLSARSGVPFLVFQILGHAVWSCLHAGDHTAAKKYLGEMEPSLRCATSLDAGLYHAISAFFLMETGGDLRVAAEHLELCRGMVNSTGMAKIDVMFPMFRVQLDYDIGLLDEARRHIEEGKRKETRLRSPLFSFTYLIAEAQVAFTMEREQEALALLGEAMALGRRHGYFVTCLWRPRIMARLCEKALEARIEVDYVRDLIRKRNLLPGAQGVTIENWPWRFEIYMLGRFGVVRDGKPLAFTGKSRQRPLSLLKALIALGGREVSEERLTDALWPESLGDTAHQSFATTLFRLRKLLGSDDAIQLREGRLTLDPRYCRVDIWAFERLLGQAEGLWKKGEAASAVQLMERASRMYQGPFLKEEAGKPWTAATRERLLSKFLRGLSTLGSYWQENGHWEKALQCYQQGLEVDELAEELYQHLMSCYQKLGRRAEALAVYERCKRILSCTFGLPPSERTEEIYRSLRSG
ncbi:MAG: BTAD domain-containing putative transcriptional regulator [Nitrospirota bacterium]|jgi:LuxR family maltose regulon positive regulatory protein